MGLGRNSGQGLYVILCNGERASTLRFWALKSTGKELSPDLWMKDWASDSSSTW